MSFTWAEARRQVRDHALKDFPCTTQVRNFYTVDSTTQDKDLKSWQRSLWGLPGSQSSIPKPAGSSDKLDGLKFTPALLGSEADIWARVIIRLWREDTLPLTSLDRAAWFLLRCSKIYCSGLGRHLFPLIYGPLWHLGEQYPLTAASDTKDSNSAKWTGCESKLLHEEDVAAA